MIKFTVPVYYDLTKDKTVLVGLNFDRSKAHYFTKNKLKKHYHKLVSDALKEIEPIEGKYRIHFTYYYRNPRSDMTNVRSLIEKYVLDGLIECGIVKDDNVMNLIGEHSDVGGLDKLNPRMEVTIRSTDE